MPSPENEEGEEGEMVRGSPAPSAQVSFKSEAARTDGFPIRFYILSDDATSRGGRWRGDAAISFEELLPSPLRSSSSGGSTKSEQIPLRLSKDTNMMEPFFCVWENLTYYYYFLSDSKGNMLVSSARDSPRLIDTIYSIIQWLYIWLFKTCTHHFDNKVE